MGLGCVSDSDILAFNWGDSDETVKHINSSLDTWENELQLNSLRKQSRLSTLSPSAV